MGAEGGWVQVVVRAAGWGQRRLVLTACLLLLPLLLLLASHLLLQVYSADEAFATGTFAGLLPVVEVDGRRIGSGAF